MTLKKAMARLVYWYDQAQNSQIVYNPVAWALYQAWKEADEEKPEKGEKRMSDYEVIGNYGYEVKRKLKPCPFCGCREIRITSSDYYPHWAVCLDCGAKVQGGTYDEEDSIRAWNRRVKEPDPDPVLEQGAEVIWHETDTDSFKAVVLDEDNDHHDNVFIFTEVGCVEHVNIDSLELTGKHYDSIKTLLKFLQMEDLSSDDQVCKSCIHNQWAELLEMCVCTNEKSEHHLKLTEDLIGCEYWQRKGDRNV